MNIKTIRYSNFWTGFNPTTFILTRLLRDSLNQKFEIITNEDVEVDLEIDSVFQYRNSAKKFMGYISHKAGLKNSDYVSKVDWGFRSRNSIKAKKAFWYTAENIRAPFGVYDATFSFDPDCESSKNAYLPYWMTLMSWDFASPGLAKFNSQVYLEKREPLARPYNACTFSSNLEPNRIRVIQAVSQVMRVDNYGKAHGRYIENKALTSSNYGYQICTENDIYPGYVTEKIFESWASQTIPIWSGLITDKLINHEAILDITGLSQGAVRDSLQITKTREIAMRSEPLLIAKPNLSFLIDTLERALK